MSKQATVSAETIERLSREIRAKRQQVQSALEASLQAGRAGGAAQGTRLYEVFASFHGADGPSASDR